MKIGDKGKEITQQKSICDHEQGGASSIKKKQYRMVTKVTKKTSNE